MEEIEELRAKAIASMPFSTNPKPSSNTGAISGAAGRFKYPKSREEGEVSTGEDLELATCSVAPTNSTNLGESVSHRLKNSATNAARSGTQGMQLRPSAVQNYQMQYHNHFKRKLPFRPRSSQPLHWHAKESNNDLVISFSDDDSGSESDGRHPKKDIERMDSTSIAHDSRVAVSLLSKSTDGIEHEPDGSKPMPKKGFVNHETISFAEDAHEISYVSQERDAENHSHPNSQNAAIKTLVGCVPGSTMSDQRLELLHHRIAARENELTVQNRSDPQKGVTVGSDSDLPCLHDMKHEAQAAGIGRHAYDTNLEVEVNEPSKKRLKHNKSSNAIDFDVPSKPDNDRTFHVGSSCTLYEPDGNNAVQSSVIKSKDSFLALSAANLHDKPLSENIDAAKNVRSDEFSKKDGVADLPSNYGSSMHTIMGNQQLIPTSDVLMPLKTFSIFQKSSGYGRAVNNEANSTEESMSFDSLVKLEELHDKELEEAQEYRRDCEVEERHALKAYRKAQRSLVEANERCTYLYAKRELFSAKFRSFVMKAPNSIPSDWLGQQIPYADALDQLHELDSSALVLRDNTPLDETVFPICNPNKSMNNDGEDSPSSDRVVKTRSDHVDVEIEKAPSFDNVQDYELLEASLRSELVARLGLRTSSKMNDINKGENNAEKRAGSIAEDMEPSPLPHDMMPTSDAKQTAKLDGNIAEDMELSPLPHDMMPISDAKQTAKLDGMERTQERSCLPDASLDFRSLPNASSNEELRCVVDLGPNNSFQENSDDPTTPEAFFSLPTSGLHSVSRHTYMIFPGYHSDTCNVKESDNIVTLKEIKVTDFIADNVGEVPKFKRPAPMGYRSTYESSVEIDPFWPLCMFEFRGKCNDEECPWQHMRATMFSKSQDDKHSNCRSTRLLNGKLDGHILPIPTYQIGPYVIKADSHQTHSVLSRSNLQYQQRGFCASFLIPFSVQRILPLDAPCLRSGDDPVADDYSWNRLSLYCRSWDDILSFKEQIKQGSVDVEQLLEMALDQFDGDLCEFSRREAILKNFQTLSLLSHAIESLPSSVVLWVVFLHIYYKKEKDITKDDMFLHAVRHNKDSYELWLLYINSRILLDDRSNAYDQALNALCAVGSRDGRNHLSPYILDIFLQMIDFLHMSGFVDKVISRLCGLLPSIEFDKRNGHSLRNICKCLTVLDRCLFWTSCIYFLLYEKLPESVMQQFEFAKNLPFELDWPSVQLASERKALALDLMQYAMKEVASYIDDHPDEIDQDSSQSLHFLAASHVKCEAALLGFSACTELLNEYLESHPSCLELVLMALSSIQNCRADLAFSAFEEALNGWPKEKPGIQCLWNQYAAYALTNDRIDSAETIMTRWYHEFPKFRDLSSFCSTTATKSLDFNSSSHTNSTCGGLQSKTTDDAFGYLNFFLYCMLHKNAADARLAIDKSLELAAPDDYLHFVKEHTLFTAASENTESQKHFLLRGLPSLLNRYLYDPRANLDSEPLSRRFIKTIKKPRIQHLVTKILGPVSWSSTLLNSVLKLCYGPSLLPETSENFKETVNFVEFLMEIIPTNHELALSVYKICIRNSVLTHSDSNSVRFWACSLLINSIFQSSPPEHIWLEAADVLKNSESSEINLWFHKQAVSIHPFSVKLWQSYADLSGDVAGEIIEAARERGIELNYVMK